jgi:hypothetical protein
VNGATDRVFTAETRAGELILAGHIFDHAARVHSFELVAELRGAMANIRP